MVINIAAFPDMSEEFSGSLDGPFAPIYPTTIFLVLRLDFLEFDLIGLVVWQLVHAGLDPRMDFSEAEKC